MPCNVSYEKLIQADFIPPHYTAAFFKGSEGHALTFTKQEWDETPLQYREMYQQVGPWTPGKVNPALEVRVGSHDNLD